MTMDGLEQLDDFWRECLQSNSYDPTKYTALLNRLLDQVRHLPQPEQDKFFLPIVLRNAEYIAIGKQDKDALRARLGIANSPSPAINTGQLAQVAAETVVRATVWQGIAALFRVFR